MSFNLDALDNLDAVTAGSNRTSKFAAKFKPRQGLVEESGSVPERPASLDSVKQTLSNKRLPIPDGQSKEATAAPPATTTKEASASDNAIETLLEPKQTRPASRPELDSRTRGETLNVRGEVHEEEPASQAASTTSRVNRYEANDTSKKGAQTTKEAAEGSHGLSASLSQAAAGVPDHAAVAVALVVGRGKAERLLSRRYPRSLALGQRMARVWRPRQRAKAVVAKAGVVKSGEAGAAEDEFDLEGMSLREIIQRFTGKDKDIAAERQKTRKREQLEEAAREKDMAVAAASAIEAGPSGGGAGELESQSFMAPQLQIDPITGEMTLITDSLTVQTQDASANGGLESYRRVEETTT
eukprot:gene13281-15690_t